jgi:putative phosphoesterase
MRIAIVSDIHGNRTAFAAVLADLRGTSPDSILHGGDLADGGSRSAEVVDWIRDLGWQSVAGNADEMLWRPEALTEFAAHREALGPERIDWLSRLPGLQVHGPVAVVHASPTTLWRAPGPEASDTELEAVYGSLAAPVVVCGHIHRPYVRRLDGMTVGNTGSVSLSYDVIRRVEYDVDREMSFAAAAFHTPAGLQRCWRSGAFAMP